MAEIVLKMEDIVEVIIQFLPGRYLGKVAQVCNLWRKIVERIRLTRIKFAVYLSPDNAKFSEFFPDAINFVTDQRIEPTALLLFMGHRPSSSQPMIKAFLQSLRNCLPATCPLIGCTGFGVIGTDNAFGSPREVENCEGLSLMMFPRCEGLEIREFYVPLRNKYKKISGIKSFLPKMQLPVKVVIVLAHPISLGKLTNLTLALRSQYGEEVVIAGGYSDSCLFNDTELTKGEIIGLVLAGNLQSTSVVVTGGPGARSMEKLYDSIDRLECSGVQKERSFNLMFSCASRGSCSLYGYKNAQCIVFNDRFPQTALVGFFGTGSFGCDREELKSKGKEAGGRDFLQTGASVFCLTSLFLVR